MLKHLSPSVDTDSGGITTMPSQMGPITNSLSPATQSDILEILQREQDHAMSLLSLSPLLSSLFISYANRAASLESAAAAPSPDSEEWKALQATIATLREENDQLGSENRETVGKLEAAATSQEAFCTLVAALKEDAEIQQDGFRILAAECAEGNDRYKRLVEESNVEKAALQIWVLDLEARREELKETVVEQQIKISKLERHGFNCLSNVPKAERRAKRKAEKEAKEQAEREAKEKAEKAWRGAREKAEREAKERLEREEKAEREAKEKAELEAKGREEEKKALGSKVPSPRESTVGEDDPSRKTSSLSKKEQKNHPVRVLDLFDIGGGEEPELPTPLTKKGKKAINTLSYLPRVARSESECWTDEEQDTSPTKPTKPTSPALTLELCPAALLSTTSESLKPLKLVKDEASTAPELLPSPSPNPSPFQFQVPSPSSVPAKTELERPLSLWERNKPKAAAPPVPTSNLFGEGAGVNSSGGGGNAGLILMSTIVGDGQSISHTSHDQKRENQRENVVEALLDSDQARRNDSAQPHMAAKPTPKPAPVPAPGQRFSGWGSWGSSLLTNIAAEAANDLNRSPSPELPSGMFASSRPPKSQPAGFGSSNKPTWGAGGAGDNNVGGATKTGPTPIAQKASSGPAWGAKPAGSTFGSGGTGWGTGPGSKFGSSVGKNLSADTATKPPESSPNTAWPEDIPESAVEIKHVPAPGGFSSAITDKGNAGNAWGWEEGTGTKGSKETSKVPSPVQERVPEPQIETSEDEFDWMNFQRKGSQTASVAQIPSMPNVPEPDNADGGRSGGVVGGKKKKAKK